MVRHMVGKTGNGPGRPPLRRRALFSSCGRYRYALWRRWDMSRPALLFVGLNPATADGERDDNTIRRCMSYARQWGYGAMAVGNLFAYHATYPAVLRRTDDPVGPDNDRWLAMLRRRAALCVGIWGNHGLFMDRAGQVAPLLGTVHCLKTTKKGQPRHVRGLPDGLEPVPYHRLWV